MGVKFTYFGGMCILVQRGDGYKILFDPYLSANPATQTLPDDLADVDLLAVSHNAFDHFGDTIEIMQKGKAILFAGGEVVRRVREEGVSYYHPGDTSLFTDMKMIREMYNPNVMAVGISSIGRSYPCEMNPREAAYATQWIGPDVAIPTHYEPGAKELAQYINYAAVTSPKTVVKTEVDKTWEYIPFQVK